MMTKTVITLNEYLSNFSLHSRQLDPVIVKWYQRKDQTNMQKPEDIAKLVHHIIGGKLKKYSGKSLHIENRDVKLWREYEA